MNFEKTEANKKKTRRIILGIVVAMVAAIVAIGIVAGAPKRSEARNREAAKQLFADETLTVSDAEPVIKRPYTVFGRANSDIGIFKWDYGWAHISPMLQLFKDEGLTDQVEDARTCVFIWADTTQAEQNSNYYWTGHTGDAWFSPVYMTVIDREDGVRYADIQLGSVPLTKFSRGYYATYYSYLYNEGYDWSTFNLDGWLATHWE